MLVQAFLRSDPRSIVSHFTEEVHCVVILNFYIVFDKMFLTQALLLQNPAVFLCLNGNLSEWVLDDGKAKRYLLIDHAGK